MQKSYTGHRQIAWQCWRHLYNVEFSYFDKSDDLVLNKLMIKRHAKKTQTGGYQNVSINFWRMRVPTLYYVRVARSLAKPVTT